MKDFAIPAKRIRTELRWLLYSFIFAFILNIYSIVKLDTEWSALVAALDTVVLLSLVLYVLLIFVRGLARLIIRLSAGNRRDVQ
jgi:hypothetical protein